jgi:uncharacterized membrane protein
VASKTEVMISATHLHAMVVHFPIALLCAGFLTELIALFVKKDFFSKAAFYMLLLGAIGAVIAYFSGDYAGEGVEDGPLKLPLELHEDAAVVTLWLAIVTALYRSAILFFKYTQSWAKWVGVMLFATLIASVARTGYLGGQLVYRHGAGVELALPDFNAKSEDVD